MTALNRALPYFPTASPPASRKDLLGVGQNPGLAPVPASTARKWLENLGFVVRQVLPEHWIVTHASSLPEFHFYSVPELSQFAVHRAHRYAETFTRETS